MAKIPGAYSESASRGILPIDHHSCINVYPGYERTLLIYFIPYIKTRNVKTVHLLTNDRDISMLVAKRLYLDTPVKSVAYNCHRLSYMGAARDRMVDISKRDFVSEWCVNLLLCLKRKLRADLVRALVSFIIYYDKN